MTCFIPILLAVIFLRIRDKISQDKIPESESNLDTYLFINIDNIIK